MDREIITNEQELIDNLILNENAYVYIKKKETMLSKRLIAHTFQEASVYKKGRFLLRKINLPMRIDDKEIYFSICVFKYAKKPSFIDIPLCDWDEIKLAYMCIVEFQSYITISKRNIAGVKELFDHIAPIDYKILSSIFVNSETTFEKISMNNMNISDKSIRRKIVESIDLRSNLSSFGLHSYILNNVRLSNNGEKMSLTLNSSRINKFSDKCNVNYFIHWANNVVDKILNFHPTESFLSTFATPEDFNKNRQKLKPIAILLILNDLLDDYEENKIEKCYFTRKDREKPIKIFKLIDSFSKLLNIKKANKNLFCIMNAVANDFLLSINKSSITLRSQKLNRIFFKFRDGNSLSLIEYLNRKNSFIVNFDVHNLIYFNRKLFKDNRLLGDIDSFISIFEPCKELNTICCEKGSFTVDSICFSDNSIFGFVEKKFLQESKYLICDDLSKEWADHIDPALIYRTSS